MGRSVCLLSNFAMLPEPFCFRGLRWNCSEACFQALLRVHPDDWHMFAVGGVLSTLETGLRIVFPESEYAKKLKHYGPKAPGKHPTGKCPMVGIVSKMAIKPKIAARAGVRLLTTDEDEHTKAQVVALFDEILHAKYSQCPEARKQLLATGDRLLVEFDRTAESKANRGKPPRWTGLVDRHGVLHGENLQGVLQGRARQALL